MSIVLQDQTPSLSLFHYTACNEESDLATKQARGIIRNDKDQVVCTSYGYTPEYIVTQQDVYGPLLQPFEQCTFFRSEEGTLFRLFFENFSWHLSTFKRIDAFASYWSSSRSFGELFMEALEYYFVDGEGKGALCVEKKEE
jgi:hypothetical protein